MKSQPHFLPAWLKKAVPKMLFVTALVSVNGMSKLHAQSFQEKYYKDGMYFFDDLQKVRQADLFQTHKGQFGLGADDEMVQVNNVVTETGKFTTKYELRHKGIPVEGSLMNVMGDKGIVQYVNGFVVTGLDVNNAGIISEQAAIDIAIVHFGATKYIWQDSTLEASLKEEDGPNATNFPQHAPLMITKKRGEEYTHKKENYQLCYKVALHSIDPGGITDVFVNANTGDVFTTQSGVDEDYHDDGTLWTWYNGYHSNLRARSCGACFNFWLHDVDRNIFTTTHGKSYFKTGFFNKDGNNNWVENNTKTAASAQWAMQRVWDYYLNRHGRWGTNYGGKRVHIQTDMQGQNTPNAFYSNTDVQGNDNGQDNIYLSRDGVKPGSSAGTAGYSMAALDVLAHEYTHGMIKASSALGSLGDFEAKALNEAYADMFGMKIEGQVMGSLDWNMGSSLGSTRYFADPHMDNPYPAPSKYMEPGYWSNWNYHANGGVMRKWFHLLTNGGTFNSQTVTGLGLEKATDIAYVTFNWWFWSNMWYREASSQTIHQVKADYGNCSNEHKQTVRSLRAVGFNVPILYCDGVPWIKGTGVTRKIKYQVEKWTAELDDANMDGGSFVWEIPQGWVGTASGRELQITQFNNFDSKEIAVTYTRDGKSSRVTKIVHFSDENWEVTNNLPVDAMRGAQGGFMVEADKGNIDLYPNPARQSFTIDLNGTAVSGTADIFDLSGKHIISLQITGATQNVATDKMPNGIYFVKVKTQAGVFTRKLTVLH